MKNNMKPLNRLIFLLLKMCVFLPACGTVEPDTEQIPFDSSWDYAEFSEIHSEGAVLYLADKHRKDITIGVNAGHGTRGVDGAQLWCHPDKTAKVTGGSTEEGILKALADTSGMEFNDGTPEAAVTFKEAIILRDILLSKGYDVLMLRDSEKVGLDCIGRTVICNNCADCIVSLHWDDDSIDYDKGCFYCSVPDEIKYLDTVSGVWEESERLGESVIRVLKRRGFGVFEHGHMDMDLMQTCYSTVPSVTLELGNQCSDHSAAELQKLASCIAAGINRFYSRAVN